MKKKSEREIENIQSYPGFDYAPLNKPLKVGDEILSNIFGSQKEFCYGIGMNSPNVPFLLTREKESNEETSNQKKKKKFHKRKRKTKKGKI